MRNKKIIRQEYLENDVYLKFYLEKDFYALVREYGSKASSKIIFTENLFHPEFKLIPKTNLIAFVDSLIQKTPFAKFISRQISLILEKT